MFKTSDGKFLAIVKYRGEPVGSREAGYNEGYDKGKSDAAPSGSVEITENGTHNVKDYAEAVVNVPITEGGGDEQFRDYLNETLVNAVIPEGVTSIGDSKFADFYDLETITFPSTLKGIGAYSFSSCWYLQNPTLNEGLEKIGSYAFADCSLFGGVFVFPSTIKELGGYIFGDGLSDSGWFDALVFKGTPTKIDPSAFEYNGFDEIRVPWSEGEVAGAPWGADPEIIIYDWIEEE